MCKSILLNPKHRDLDSLTWGGGPRAAHNVPDGSHKPPGRLEATVIGMFNLSHNLVLIPGLCTQSPSKANRNGGPQQLTQKGRAGNGRAEPMRRPVPSLPSHTPLLFVDFFLTPSQYKHKSQAELPEMFSM